MTTTVQIILAIALTASVILAWIPGIKMTLDDLKERKAARSKEEQSSMNASHHQHPPTSQQQ